MKHLLSVSEVRKADKYAIEKLGIKSSLLMENAGRSSADIIIELISDKNIQKCIIFCGSGNNGGDGLVIARHLRNRLKNIIITIYFNGDCDSLTPESKMNFDIVKNMNIEIIFMKDLDESKNISLDCNLIIDALIGVGGSDSIRGSLQYWLRLIENTSALKIAIDAPTGIDCDEGKAFKSAFNADYTITMFAGKKGFYLNEAKNLTGEIITAYLGAPEYIVEEISKIKVLEEKDVRDIINYRKSESSKFDFGKVLIIGGCSRMPGAAALCANAAVRSGAGLTYLFSKKIHSGVFPEVIINELQGNEFESKDFDILAENINKYDVVAIGPGMGNSKETIELIRKLIFEIDENVDVVIDADALKSINHKDILRKNIILTPHIGEFARLIQADRNEIESAVHNLVVETSEKMNCIIHLKHHPSITTDGNQSYWLTDTHPGLSCGGSGDVLTGITSALLAQKINPLDAAGLAAYIHINAAKIESVSNGYESFKASDIIKGLKGIFK